MTIQLVVGLGNPGVAYGPTRHNVGFRVADELVSRHGGSWQALDLNLAARLPGLDDLWVAKPQAFMNRSGMALDYLLAELEIDISTTLVVVDDVDLPVGRLRLRPKGGPGTHNGLRDICDRFGRDYPRARIGVGGEDPVADLADFVLSPFTAAEDEQVADVISRTADAVEAAVRDGVPAAMNLFNRVPASTDETEGSEQVE